MYYIYELQMPKEMADQFQQMADKRGISTDELFCETLKYYIDHPEELKALHEEYKDQPELVKVVREYPVMDGESEADAKLRALEQEEKNIGVLSSKPAAHELPTVSEQELLDHVEDEDFFTRYGNPVLVQSKDGSEVVFMSFELYERMMREAGKGDEIDQVKADIEQADTGP